MNDLHVLKMRCYRDTLKVLSSIFIIKNSNTQYMDNCTTLSSVFRLTGNWYWGWGFAWRNGKKNWPILNILLLAHSLFCLIDYLPTREETGYCTPVPQPKISRSVTLTQTCILPVIRILIFHCWDHRPEVIEFMPLGKGGEWELVSNPGRLLQPCRGRTQNRRTSCVLKLAEYFQRSSPLLENTDSRS